MRHDLLFFFTMNILSILLALLLEQRRPPTAQAEIRAYFERWAAFLDDQFNSGERHHGLLAWILAVLPVLGVALGLNALLTHWTTGFSWLLNTLVLLLLLNFRTTLADLTALQQRLRPSGQERNLAEPQREDSLGEITLAIAAGIEQALIAIHTQLLAVLFWYFWLPGCSGALLYWMAHQLNQRWGTQTDSNFGHFSRRAFEWLDWIPLRLTALAFAIVGNFEDSLFCWRTQASASTSTQRIVLASAAGALGIRLGDASSPQRVVDGLELGVGELPEIDHLRSAEGMIWRTVILWLLLMSMLSVAALVGH